MICVIQEVLYRLFAEEFERHAVSSASEVYVTALVQCPLKFFFSIKYRDIARVQIYQPQLIVGKILHIGLERLLEKSSDFEIVGFEVDVEKRISIESNGLPMFVTIRGRIDVLTKVNGELVPVEIKTARGDYNIPSEHHVLQLRIYMNMVNASKGVLFYLTPDRIAEITIEKPLDDYDLQKLVEGFMKRKGPRYGWECGYCPFNILCSSKRPNSKR